MAKELGISSREVLAHLESIGQPVKSHSSTIDEPLAQRVREDLSNGVTPAEADAATGAAPAPVAETAPAPVA
ncbi:MAG: translation initiation factor IF-2 N-terminal domain-containing protein, partial [Actinobacteria bacterium]|nr:translation initiation factor IF-2 N-terminal domain-containing protein [Actinomycetota bacterium]